MDKSGTRSPSGLSSHTSDFTAALVRRFFYILFAPLHALRSCHLKGKLITDTDMKEVADESSLYHMLHILDEDRKVNAQKFETAFMPLDLRNNCPPEEPVKSELMDPWTLKAL